MRLDRVTVAGVLRFAAPVTLDLTGVPPGLVAVVGANGEGKSTLMDAPFGALYRTFPSRAEHEVINYAHGRDAFLEAVLTTDTGRYRARVNLDAEKRASDAVLEHTGPDGAAVLLNDGKVSTFDAAVRRVFPPLEVLLASVVAAQNRAGSFPALDRRGKKDLFVKLLGLDRYETLATTARQAGQLHDTARQGLLAQREVLARAGDPAIGDEIGGLLTATEHQGLQALAQRRTLHARRDALRDQRPALETAAAEARAATARLRDLATEAAAHIMRSDGLRRQTTAAEAATTTEVRLTEANLANTCAILDERIANNRTLVARGAEVRAAVDTAAGLVDRVQAQRDLLTARRREQDDRRAAIDRARADVQHSTTAARELVRAQAGAELLGQVPCGGAGDFGGCQFLTQAREARESIPALQLVAGALADRQRVFDAWCAEDQAGRDAIAAIERGLPAIEQQHADASALAQLRPQLEAAESRVDELTRDRAASVAQATSLVAAARDRLATTLADLQAQRVALDAEVDRNAAETAAASATQLRTAPAAAQLVALDAELTSIATTLEQTAATIARLEAEMQALTRRHQAWTAAAQELATVDRRRREVETDGREWAVLAKAFGREGLPVLEIDASGPTVSAMCNDLLSVCFGPRFTVELITQAEKADGKGTKEVFDLRVYDNQRGGAARELNDLSGGEQVLVDECLKNALALFVNRRGAGAFQTCWRDETTSPLDGENARRYIEMLRRVQQLGGFAHVLFVTHNPAAAALADAQVRVADGALSIAMAPFAEAA